MKIKEAEIRLFNRVFICRKCNSKIRGNASKIKARKRVCKKCQSRDFRPKNKEKRVVK
tara:strand:+ start:384 stop:557 length:174 start_codon:yes stop_codon:yes gene_type:complete